MSRRFLLVASAACFLAAGRVASAEPADRLCVVQFIHPGSEHEPDLPDGRTWNTNAHRRKFLLQDVRYQTDPSANPVAGPAVFWAEWEPPSRLVGTLETPTRDHPRFLFSPYRERFRALDPPLMNTDPFVYGGRFFYAICKQNTRKGPTAMQRLADGSVILFGSGRERNRFVLDTVLVVAGHMDYTVDNYRDVLAGQVPPEYIGISLDPIAHEANLRGPSSPRTFRLYFGATKEHPVNGMYSYFPCRPYKENEAAGFPRPTIRRAGVITDNLTQGQRFNPQSDPAVVKAIWDDVTAQVLGQGLSLGVSAEMPSLSPR